MLSRYEQRKRLRVEVLSLTRQEQSVDEIRENEKVQALLNELYPVDQIVRDFYNEIIRDIVQAEVNDSGQRRWVSVTQGMLPLPEDDVPADDVQISKATRERRYKSLDKVRSDPKLMRLALAELQQRVCSLIKRAGILHPKLRIRLLTQIDLVFGEAIDDLGAAA